MDRERDGQLRRLAAQLLSALPEDTNEARRVLNYALWLLAEWVDAEPEPGPPDGGNVTAFRRARGLIGSALIAVFALAAWGTICLGHSAIAGLKASYALQQIRRYATLEAAVYPIQGNTRYLSDLPGIIDIDAAEAGFVIVPGRGCNARDAAPSGLHRIA
jgi:hypothetical protein